MKKLLPLCLLVILAMVAGCSGETEYKYWPLSHFDIDTTALEDGEEVKLIYSSRGPDREEHPDYYIHVMVKSLETGDTVNVLTDLHNGFTREAGKKTYNFFKENSLASKIIKMDTEEMKNFKLEEVEKKQTKRHTKVARDPDFDHLADNDHPAIIGTIGKMETQ